MEQGTKQIPIGLLRSSDFSGNKIYVEYIEQHIF